MALGRVASRGFVAAIVVWLTAMPGALAVWNGISTPPTGQPDGTEQVSYQLPEQPAQQAVTEEECNRDARKTGEICPSGFDWYFRTDDVLQAGIGLNVRYQDSYGEAIGEGSGRIGFDGNLSRWDDWQVRVRYDYQYDESATPDSANGSAASNYSDWQKFDLKAGYRIQQDYFFRGLDYGFKGSYGDVGETFRSTQDGFYPAEQPPTNYWPGLDWSMGDAFGAQPAPESGDFGDPDNVFEDAFETGDMTSWGLSSGVSYDINPDGWRGIQLGYKYETAEDANIAPVTRQPRYEIGTKPGYGMPLAMKFGYVDGKIQAVIPDDAGGGLVGSYVPSEPTRTWQDYAIGARYQPDGALGLGANYSFSDGQDIQYFTPSFSGFQASDAFSGWIAQDPAVLYVRIEICNKVLESGGSGATKAHVRLTPPTAADFVNNPDEPRTRWHPDYDGALPIIVDDTRSKARLGEAIGRLVNAKHSWFVAWGPSAKLADGSAVGQGGPSVVTGPDPEVAVGDDECNRTKTVLVGGDNSTKTVSDPPGDGTKPREPCDCAKEQAALDAAKKSLDKANSDYAKAKAEYEAADREVTKQRRLSGGATGGNPAYQQALARNNKAVKASDQAYAARSAAKKALEKAQKALDACKAKCPTAGGGTAPGTVTGPPTGPSTATDGDKDKPCNCNAEQAALTRAEQELKKAEKALRDAQERRKKAKENYEKIDRNLTATQAWKPFTKESIEQRKKDLEKLEKDNAAAVKESDAAYAAEQAAKKAVEAATKAHAEAAKALADCRKACPEAGSGPGGGVDTTTGPQGPATATDGDKDKACDCKKEQAEVDRLRRETQEADKAHSQAEKDLRAARERESAAEAEKKKADATVRRIGVGRDNLDRPSEPEQGKNFDKAEERFKARDRDWRRAQADTASRKYEAELRAKKAVELRAAWAKAQKALEACQKKCGK